MFGLEDFLHERFGFCGVLGCWRIICFLPGLEFVPHKQDDGNQENYWGDFFHLYYSNIFADCLPKMFEKTIHIGHMLNIKTGK